MWAIIDSSPQTVLWSPQLTSYTSPIKSHNFYLYCIQPFWWKVKFERFSVLDWLQIVWVFVSMVTNYEKCEGSYWPTFSLCSPMIQNMPWWLPKLAIAIVIYIYVYIYDMAFLFTDPYVLWVSKQVDGWVLNGWFFQLFHFSYDVKYVISSR